MTFPDQSHNCTDNKDGAVGAGNCAILNSGSVISIVAGQKPKTLAIPHCTPIRDDFELLRWDASLSKLHGRDADLEDLQRWAHGEEPVQARVITGPGGAGKTRLAMEFGRLLQAEGWDAGELDLHAEAAYFLGRNGTLLIIDYPEESRKEIRSFLSELIRSKSPGSPLRVLLLTRQDEGFWGKEIEGAGASALFGNPALRLGPLEGERVLYTVFREAWESVRNWSEFASRTSFLPAENDFLDWLKLSPLHSLPLFIIACAVQHHHDPDVLTHTGAEIVGALVERQIGRLRKESTDIGLQETDLPRLLCLAAIRKGLAPADLKAAASSAELQILQCDPNRAVDLIYASGRMSGPFLPPPQPGLFAAALVAREFSERPDLAPEWLWLCISGDSSGPLAVFARLCHDAEEVLGQTQARLSSLLTAAVDGNIDRCRLVTRALAEIAETPAFLPARVAALKTLASVTGAEAGTDPKQASLLNELTVTLIEAGSYAEALKTCMRAVEVIDRLAGLGAPAAVEPDLAAALAALLKRHENVAQPALPPLKLGDEQDAKAEEFAGEAEDVSKTAEVEREEDRETRAPAMEGAEPAGNAEAAGGGAEADVVEEVEEPALQHGAETAGASEDAASREAAEAAGGERPEPREEGRRAFASASAEPVLTLAKPFAARRQETKLEPVSVREAVPPGTRAVDRDLAKCLNNLGIMYSNSGRPGDAVKATERAVEIRERLAVLNPGAYDRHLAKSLYNLGVMYATQRRHDKALGVTRRSVQIREKLAAANPKAYERDLAKSLYNLGMISFIAGRREEGLEASVRSMEIREKLAHINPKAFERDLAKSLNNLGVIYLALHRPSDALGVAVRAVEIRGRLAAQAPEALERDLAKSLYNLGVIYSTLKRYHEGADVMRRAVEIQERLAGGRREAADRELAKSLGSLGVMYSRIGKPLEAMRATERAVEIYDRLARMPLLRLTEGGGKGNSGRTKHPA